MHVQHTTSQPLRNRETVDGIAEIRVETSFRLLPFVLVLLFAGCAHLTSTIRVTFDVDLHVKSTINAVALWESQLKDIGKSFDKRGDSDGLPRTTFRESLFSASFKVFNRGFEMDLVNNSPGLLCFHLDQATISSNFLPTGLPLKHWSRNDARGAVLDEHRTDNRTAPRDRQTLPKQCLAPGEHRTIHAYLYIVDVFPNGLFFNVSHPKHLPELTQSGIGNWFSLRFPLNAAGRHEDLEFKLTATGHRASKHIVPSAWHR